MYIRCWRTALTYQRGGELHYEMYGLKVLED